ncbi:taurine catabolism dioxygenase [Fusarium albosuccineum]|uniref:Taurine catabolism dioxygenase n=1 Tax=Fusarium albosuccineum TaxID=1237068 RepID=A0A8H4L891_9HYPO|nr:taurine catabolism dioxygenase [Fusarium albosuccineum]
MVGQVGSSLGAQTVSYYSSGVQARFPAQLFKGAGPLPQTTQYADVSYEYDEQKHLKRTEARLRAGGLGTDLPTGWPKALRLGMKDKDIKQSSFPLPNLGKTLSKIRTDIYHGRGFATLRGLNVDALSPADMATAYLGLTSHVADKRGKQNQQGTMMINVVNTGKEVERDNAHVVMVWLLVLNFVPSLTQQPFHTDLVCDTLSMLTLSCGPVGGSGFLASAWTVYNELAETRPDLIRVLAEPDWPFDTHGRDPPYYKRALLY